ncbi:MAG: PEP-CTERM sorting domain-containing protein, partial [Kiritimatiellales bacterium]
NAFTLGSADLAGLVGNEAGNSLGSTMAVNWNNLNGNTGSDVGNLTGSGGAVISGATVSWSADNVWDVPSTTGGTNTSANTTMMRGYLDNNAEHATTVTVSGLEALNGTYSVVVFIDGANGSAWTRGLYTIGGTTVLNEDSEGVDFNSGSGNNANGVFQIPVEGASGNLNWPFSPNNSEGNMIIFTGLTGASFTLTATPSVASDMGNQRAPINGIQIVGVIPEPASALLMSTVTAAAFFIRRRFTV